MSTIKGKIAHTTNWLANISLPLFDSLCAQKNLLNYSSSICIEYHTNDETVKGSVSNTKTCFLGQ